RLTQDPAHNVTLTLPNGRRSTFFFEATTYPSFFSFLLAPGYVPEAGSFGTLASDGCPLMVVSAGQLVCFLESSLTYAPTTFTYTDPNGAVYTMAATGTLKSIRDLSGNTLTFASDGITSSAGNVHLAFQRDAQGRITQITDLAGHVYGYTY